jgi:hypothetical protein
VVAVYQRMPAVLTLTATQQLQVSRGEFQAVGKRLGIRQVDAAWVEAVSYMQNKETQSLNILDAAKIVGHGEVNYFAFIHAFNTVMGVERRLARQGVRSLFMSMQSQPSGLTKAEMGAFVRRCERRLMLLPPAFELELDWAGMLREISMRRVGFGGGVTVDGRGESALSTLVNHRTADSVRRPSRPSFRWPFGLGFTYVTSVLVKKY